MIALHTDLVAPTESELRERYSGYRRHQARALVSMLPREAIRPLYRRARAWAERTADERPTTDPLEVLVRYCEELLPLPTYEAWRDDVRRNPDAYLMAIAGSSEAPTATSPATLESRRLATGRSEWTAHLRGFRDDDAWRGFIAFEASGSERVHRTTLIFRETTPTELRARFMEFETATLEAFLRSALP